MRCQFADALAVTKATLRIYPNSSGTDLHAYSVTSSDWTEDGVTWNNAPAFGPEIGSSAPVTTGTYVDIDVTSAVQADGPHDIGLQTTGPQLNLASRQDTAGHAPQLLIDTTG